MVNSFKVSNALSPQHFHFSDKPQLQPPLCIVTETIHSLKKHKDTEESDINYNFPNCPQGFWPSTLISVQK